MASGGAIDSPGRAPTRRSYPVAFHQWWWPRRESVTLDYPPSNSRFLLASFMVRLQASHWSSYWWARYETVCWPSLVAVAARSRCDPDLPLTFHLLQPSHRTISLVT